MNERISFSLVTPDRQVVEEFVTSVTIPAANGEMQALPQHTPYVARLGIGILRFTLAGGVEREVCVTGGYVEVLPEQVTVMVRSAELPEEIDPERAKAAMERAEKRLMNPDDDTDMDRARAALARAIERLKLSSGH